MLSDLKNKALRGVLWSAVDKCIVRIMALGISVILARILSPEDYGLIGMIMVFITLSNLLVDSGFSQALVQKHTPSEEDYSTAFYFNIGIGIICYFILFVLSPIVALFFQTPLLETLLKILSLVLIANSLTVVQRAKLLIEIDFKRISIINIVSTILSGILAIYAAYSDFGVWALVIQIVLRQFIVMVLYWIFGRWWPKCIFSKSSFLSLFRFGSKLLIAGTVATIVTNVYNMVIGKMYRAKELGFYTKAYELSEVAAGTINEIINSVTFPLLSAVKEDKARLVSIYSKMLSMTAFIVLPAMTLLTLLAKPFVIVVLTEKWLPAVPLIQWLCFARMLTPISALNMNVLNAIGRSDLFMKVDFTKLPLVIFIMVLTLPISVEAVVIGNFIATFICYFINAYLPGKLLGFGIRQQTRIFKKILLSTCLMVVTTLCVMNNFDTSLYQLLIGVIVGILSYILYAYILGVNEIYEVKIILKNNLGLLK
ncbi:MULTISPECIES: lipopolysaccharide biosynthesis protein [Butyricimonas]|uniref:lipopolysaccharide biosynthesis protein n=1 Tax=Butyricimonas TaxID=574697 RepID=UPI0022E52FB0|nr:MULTISPECIES: lipopolysaccharide biosynthesis protein [Butyricimonas]